MRVAIVEDGRVSNVVLADRLEELPARDGVVFIEDPEGKAFPGAILGSDGAFVAPPPAPKEPKYVYSKMEFRRRFTLDELMRFDVPEDFLPSPTPEQRRLIRVFQRNYDLAKEIDLRDPLTQQGILLMAQWGLITQDRANAILDPANY
jgi:hypothetical protein